MRWLKLTLAVLVIAANKALTTFGKIRIPAATIQSLIEQKFPVQMEQYWLTLALCNPLVKLDESANKIGIELTLRLTAPGNICSEWRGLVEGRLDYNREKGEFYFLEPVLQLADIQGFFGKYQNLILSMAGILLTGIFATTPVYKLNQEDYKQVLTRLLLKSVTVQKDQLLIELSLY
jgi:hypothetical protein